MVNARRAKLCLVPPIVTSATTRLKSLQDNSLAVLGVKLYNCLPANIRAYEGKLDGFKKLLDKHLRLVVDQPCLDHYYQSSRSNSILDQIKVSNM